MIRQFRKAEAGPRLAEVVAPDGPRAAVQAEAADGAAAVAVGVVRQPPASHRHNLPQPIRQAGLQASRWPANSRMNSVDEAAVVGEAVAAASAAVAAPVSTPANTK